MAPDLVWTHHPVFGIVHPSGCNVCTSYMRHVADATQLDFHDDSLRLSIKERDSQHSIQYLRGVSEGICLQARDFDASATDLLQKYRAEHVELLEMINLRTAQLVAAEQELIEVREQFKALEALLDDAAVFPTSADLAACSVESSTIQDVHSASEMTREDQLKPTDTCSLPTPPPTPPINESVSLSFWSSGQEMTDHRDTGPSNATLADIHHYSPVVNDVPVEPTSESTIISSLQELAVLISKARSGDEQASISVDAIYTAARSIPEVDRTSYQQFVILEWKPRPFSSSIHVTSPIITAGSKQSDKKKVQSGIPEIFVDSSGWGIGFVLDRRWLAWKLMPGWQGDGRDNNWAEMVAVELGLLVLASAGYRSRTVIVRSDNTGVVKALQKGTSKHPRQPEVLRRIKAITQSHGFVLEVRWVSTEYNHADRPSRGHPPPDALRFPATIDLPDELLPFLSNSM